MNTRHFRRDIQEWNEVTSQNTAKIHSLMLFSGQNHFALEPSPGDSQVRPAMCSAQVLSMGQITS